MYSVYRGDFWILSYWISIESQVLDSPPSFYFSKGKGKRSKKNPIFKRSRSGGWLRKGNVL